MAYYYYYQPHHSPPGPISPGTTVGELTPQLPPLLLLSPSPQQQQLNMPLLTPLLPSLTTPVPMVSTSATVEHFQQQLPPTPNTFIRHCEDMGLFHDLQNIMVMSSLNGTPGVTTTTSVPVSNSATMVSTTSSTEQPITSTAIITTMMMANPFDETFKQAVLQQQKNDINSSESSLNNSNNNNDGELNTPFIATTTVVSSSDDNNNSSLTLTESADITSTPVVAASSSFESMTTNTITVPHPQQQSVYITSSATEAPARGVLLMMGQQQQHNPVVSIQTQNQQQHNTVVSVQPQIIDQLSQKQQFIVPVTTAATCVDSTTVTRHDHCYGDENTNDHNVIDGGSETTTSVKQALKQNLLLKRLQKDQQRPTKDSKTHHKQQQNSYAIDVLASTAATLEYEICNNKDQENGSDPIEQQLKRKHIELLERNRSAAKRCRIKRKQRWEMLSAENRKLKIENSRLRDALGKLINHSVNTPKP